MVLGGALGRGAGGPICLGVRQAQRDRPQSEAILPPPSVRGSDEVDVAAPGPGPAPRWRAVWARLHDAGLPRDVQVLGWRILHCALNVGACRVYRQGQVSGAWQEGHSDGVCSHAACVAQPETLSHVFLHCPVAVLVTQWLCDVWERVTGGQRPPRSAAVLLADDITVWDPGLRLRPLWTVLRLMTLSAIWSATVKRGRIGLQASATSIAAKVVYSVRLLMEQDWQLAAVDIRLHSGVCSALFRGRAPHLSLAAFEGKWCHRGVLAGAPAGGLGQPLVKPTIRLSASWPVPLPGLRRGVVSVPR
jgi:hypothetical protein